jgi:N-carbamoyl-L-amino-acid hydrolase
VSDFERMWRDLAPIGRSAATGGYHRQPFTGVDAELRAWFAEECTRRGLAVERDPFGNVVGWWRPLPPIVSPETRASEPPEPAFRGGLSRGGGVLTGSHLDSVPDGGAYDGPLGVVSGLAALDLLRERGTALQRPVGVAVFAEEEGSRFGLGCLGSRLATGRVDWEGVAGRRDPAGVTLGDAVEAAGLGPPEPGPESGQAGSGSSLLDDVGCFVELHVEQGRGLVDIGRAVGLASGIWPHGRYRFDFHGEADHAGTTRMEDRRDPMLSFAMTALAANQQARVAGQRATFGRVEASPNGTNAVPSRVTGWLDARCSSEDALDDLVAAVTGLARQRAERDGTRVEVTEESVSGAVGFDAALTGRLAGHHPEGDWPVLPTQAGHDAGVLSAAGIPSAMLFVRNPTGVSHSPAEHAELADCLAGVDALAESLSRLAS